VVADDIVQCLLSMGEQAIDVRFHPDVDIEHGMSMVEHVEAVAQVHCEVMRCLQTHNRRLISFEFSVNGTFDVDMWESFASEDRMQRAMMRVVRKLEIIEHEMPSLRTAGETAKMVQRFMNWCMENGIERDSIERWLLTNSRAFRKVTTKLCHKQPTRLFQT